MADRPRINLRHVPRFARTSAVVVALGLATSPATAGAASITVTPNTGLNPSGQDVNITGAGWSPGLGQIDLYQCTEGGTGGVCHPLYGGTGSNRLSVVSDAGGGFSVTVPVTSLASSRIIVPATPAPFDCRDPADQTNPIPGIQRVPCELRAIQYVPVNCVMVQEVRVCQSAPVVAAAPIRFARQLRPPCIGCADTPDPEDTTPVARALGVSPFGFPAANRGASIAARSTGTTVRYRLSQAATTRFRVQAERPGRRVGRRCVRPTRANRNRTRCRRYVTVSGGFSHRGTQGQNSFRFTGRLRGRKLPVGFYRLRAVPTNGGNDGPARFARFRIVP